MKRIAIIIDMQNDFVTGSLANKSAQSIVPKVAKFIEEFDGDIVFTRDTHDKGYLKTNEGEHLQIEHCIKGTKGHQICQKLLGIRDAVVIDKSTFGSVELLDYLSKQTIVKKEKDLEIHLVGTCTDICVITNALLIKTEFPECKVIVHSKLCAGLDKQGHDAALLVMQRCQVEVID